MNTPKGQVPEALRLADQLDLYATGDEYQRTTERAAAELRRLHALAAGQAVAPAEPDPTPGDHPPPCDSELFESGVSVGLFDIPKWTAEALCKGIAAATGARVDWHYIAGRVHVKAFPAPPAMDGGDAARLKEAVDLLEELVEHDSYSTEYDGRMIVICPECGEQEGEHRPNCAFVRAKAYLAARAAQKES